MPVTLIESLLPLASNTRPSRLVENGPVLYISEMFADTIQGEGVYAGHPATFIRLQGCVLNCSWCDTKQVWPYGNPYSFDDIIRMLLLFKEKYRNGSQHIVLTGGSPLKQQTQLVAFLIRLREVLGFKPIIQVENEAVIQPRVDFMDQVDIWNNSPKLSNSGMRKEVRLIPDVLKIMNNNSMLQAESWFKFVIREWKDWDEIEQDFLPYIHRHKIILMPEGQTQSELDKVREQVIKIAVRVGVRYCDRLHVVAWNKRTGV